MEGTGALINSGVDLIRVFDTFNVYFDLDINSSVESQEVCPEASKEGTVPEEIVIKVLFKAIERSGNVMSIIYERLKKHKLLFEKIGERNHLDKDKLHKFLLAYYFNWAVRKSDIPVPDLLYQVANL